MEENYFKYLELKSGTSLHGQTQTHCIVFVIKGCADIACNEFAMTLSEREMIFIHQNTHFKYFVHKECQALVAAFQSISNEWNKFASFQLKEIKKSIEYEIKPFAIKDILLSFLYSLRIYLKEGIICSQLNELKFQELFWIFTSYYSKEELASFLYVIIGNIYSFRDKVLKNYSHANTVKELADLCGIPLSSFKKQFAAEFGEAPYSWMQKRMLGVITFRLADNELPLKYIMDELKFSSLPQLVRFCKRHLGKTPGEIRKQINGKSPDKKDIT